jgi:hypothetical protein
MSRPLWEVMADAYAEATDSTIKDTDVIRVGNAAEIRALAEIIEQRGAQGLDLDPGETADWLRTEADRAEGRG